MAYKSKDVLNSMAKTAADTYLKSKTALNESLTKVASSEGLDTHQIEYVAAEANKMVWASHYGKDKKAAYDFPLADPKQIIDDLQIKPTEKVAEVNLDYMLPPGAQVKQAQDKTVCGVFETDITSEDKRRELKHTLQNRYEKLAQAKEDTAGEMIMVRASIENLEKRFVKEARELIMQTPFGDRPQAMDMIAEFVRGSGYTGPGVELMKKLSSKIIRDGLVKQADLKAPEAYISETLPARIVNGNHSLYITLQTIVQKEEMYEGMRRNFIICDDTLPVLKEKIRGL